MTAQAQIVETFDALQTSLQQRVERARAASRILGLADADRRDDALRQAAKAIEADRDAILAANRQDMERSRKEGLAASMLDRLELTDDRLSQMTGGLEEIADQSDPIGQVFDRRHQPSGIEVAHMRVPIGLIAIIYESRPNVTADAAGLCLKAGNGCILHGGKEAQDSNVAIHTAMTAGLEAAGLPGEAVQMLMPEHGLATEFRHRAVQWLLGAETWVDLAIPRGGKNLASTVSEYARVPVLKHLEGICHMYLHAQADLQMAEQLSYNAKCYRYSICCSAETLLLDRAIAPQLLPRLASGFAERGVEVRGCEASRKLVSGLVAATEQDWHTEYLAPVISVRVVENPDEAIAHIERYGSAHTDSIVTEDAQVAARFLREVDSSSVMHNLPTVFADGKEYGLGAEIGISTGKLHARGPIGAADLTSCKFVVTGAGEQRS